jgi:hypothetical protein
MNEDLLQDTPDVEERGPEPDLTAEIGEPVISFGVFGSPAMCSLVEALAHAQGAFEPVKKNRTAKIQPRDAAKSAYTFDYADMDSIRSATQPALSANGLAIVSLPVMLADGRHLRTMLMHKAGGYMYADLPIPQAGDGNITEVIKVFGGLITYLRRYSVIALLNISADNDLDEHGDTDAFGHGRISNGGPAVHPDMKAAKSVAELARVMGGLSKADKAKYSEYFNLRQHELKEAQQ